MDRDGGPGRTDEIDDSAFDLRLNGIGRGEAAHRDHRSGSSAKMPIMSYRIAIAATALLCRKAHSYSTGIAHGVFGILDQFTHQPHAVLERSAVFLGPSVDFGRQVVMRRVNVNDTKTGFFDSEQ